MAKRSLQWATRSTLLIGARAASGVVRRAALVGLAETGKLTLELTAKGGGGHSSRPPHVPSLKYDYQKIQSAALQNMQAINFENWLETAKKNVYIEIKPTECSNALKNWVE